MYRTTILFNHPPLTAYYLQWIYELQRFPALESLGITFPFLLRLPGILADFVVVAVLVDLGRRAPGFQAPTWAMVLFALSPGLVDGFRLPWEYRPGDGDVSGSGGLLLCPGRGNSFRDFLCPECAGEDHSFVAFSVPFLFWVNRRLFLRFALPAATVSLVLWFQPLFQFPAIFIKNVLSYSSFWGIWGISYLIRLTGLKQFAEVSFFDLSPAQNLMINICKVMIIPDCPLSGLAAAKTSQSRTLEYNCLCLVSLLCSRPGICTQYLIWLAPFVLLLSPSFTSG